MFAFAVTLLVVSLEVPHTFDELWLAMRQFFAFAICFALLFQVWWRHFNFFRRYGLEDAPTIALTGILLFVVLFYVYPLKFVFTLVIDQVMGSAPNTRRRSSAGGAAADADLQRRRHRGLLGVHADVRQRLPQARRARSRRGRALEARVSIIDNAGLALIGVLSFAIATFGGPRAASAIAGRSIS